MFSDVKHRPQAMRASSIIAILCCIALLLSHLAPVFHELSHRSHSHEHHQHATASVSSECHEQNLDHAHNEQGEVYHHAHDQHQHESCSICTLIQLRQDSDLNSEVLVLHFDQAKSLLKNDFYRDFIQSEITTYYEARAGPQIS